MIGGTLKVTLVIALISYFILILKFLKEKALALKYTLLWIFSGIVMGMMVLFPNLLTKFVNLLGIQSNMNGLFICCIGFIIMILMAITSIVSKQNRKIRVLIQEMAILEKKLRELEETKEN